MYQVSIYNAGAFPLDVKVFPFGEFAEIGFWLDENGYNVPEYRAEIKFQVQS